MEDREHRREAPDIAVAVPSHDRPLRLRFLLNALEEQTLDKARFEVVIAHDSHGPETETLLRTHPLTAAGVARHLRLRPGTAPPGANRNAAWRATDAPLIAFTDDDCRPPPDWLERALEAARRYPGAIVQGRTEPDPHEAHLMVATHARTQSVPDPPGPYAQACNIVYPRELLERVGGFDEKMNAGEDTELALRARKAGAPYVGSRDMRTYHAVSTPSLAGRLRSLWRWRDLPALVKRHPEYRSECVHRVFWKAPHRWLPLALAGSFGARRYPWLAVLLVPWALETSPRYGRRPRALVRATVELPARAAIDLTELLVLVWGSIRYRTLLL